MRLLRGKRFVLACVLAVAASFVAAGAWTGYLSEPQWLFRRMVTSKADHYHRQAAIIRELEPIFQRMDAALVKALAPLHPVCREAAGGCVLRSDPATGYGRPAFGSWVSSRRAGNFRYIGLHVSRDANTAARFTLSMTFSAPGGRMKMSEQERAALLQIARALGFTTNEEQSSIVKALAEAAGAVGPDRPNAARTAKAGGVLFTGRALVRGEMDIDFAGSIPRAFAAPR